MREQEVNAKQNLTRAAWWLATAALAVLLCLDQQGAAQQAESPTERADAISPYRHESNIVAAAFSPDGKRLVTVDYHQTAIVWEVNIGRKICRVDATGRLAALGPDGKLLAVASEDGTVVVWDVDAAKKRRTLVRHVAMLRSLEFDKDGSRLLTASNDGTAVVWDVVAGRALQEFNVGIPLTCAAFKPDEPQIATASASGEIIFWDTASGKKLRTFNAPKQPLDAPIPNEQWYKHNYVWRRQGYRNIKLAFSPNGKRLIADSPDGTAIIWNAATGEKLHVLKDRRNASLVAFTTDGKQVLTVFEEESRRWTEEGKYEVVTYYPEQVVAAWDVETGRQIDWRVRTMFDALAIRPDGRQVVARPRIGSNVLVDISLLDVGANPRVVSFCEHLLPPLAFSADGRQILAGANQTVVLRINAATNAISFDARSFPFIAAFAPNGKRIAIGGYDWWKVRDVDNVTLLHEHLESKLCQAASFNNDGLRLLVCDGDGEHFFDIPSGTTIETFRDGRCAAFSLNGKQFAIGGTGIVLYEGDSRKSVRELKTDKDYFTAVASHDGMTLAAGTSDGSIGLWDAASGRRLRTLSGHAGECKSLAFSRDGTRLISGSADRSAIIWNTATGEKIHTLAGHYAELTSVWFSPDGRLVATAARDGAAIYWDVDSGKQLLMVVVSDLNQDWLAVTPDGLYDGSEAARVFYSLRAGDGLDAAEMHHATGKLYRPGLATAILSRRNPN